jgi:hypothetical protein
MQWMIPDLSLSTQANLEASRRAIRKEGPNKPQETADHCAELLRLTVMQQQIIRSAARYILELETAAALAQKPPARIQRRSWWRRLLGQY